MKLLVFVVGSIADEQRGPTRIILFARFIKLSRILEDIRVMDEAVKVRWRAKRPLSRKGLRAGSGKAQIVL